MTADGHRHAAEVRALTRLFPGWTVWFGPFTGTWWALPPRDRDVGALVEAETPQRLIARIEVVQQADPSASTTDQEPRPYGDPRQDARRPSNLLRLEGHAPAPFRRVPVVAWPGSTAR
mgnify:CR=1 FL=1